MKIKYLEWKVEKNKFRERRLRKKIYESTYEFGLKEHESNDTGYIFMGIGAFHPKKTEFKKEKAPTYTFKQTNILKYFFPVLNFYNFSSHRSFS